ncbi:MAG: hypothetical protein R3B57_14005 [Phycisphaerales bacterium]
MTEDLTPPTDRTTDDEFDLREAPKWPKVVGIISIVWGALGLLCGVGGLAMMPLSSSFMEPMLEGDPPPPTVSFGPVDYGLAALGPVLAILLIAAGIMTINRKRAGWAGHLLYACISIPLLLFATYNNFQKQAGLEQWAQDYPANKYAEMISKSQGMQQTAGAVTAIVMLVIFLAYPLFCLIWFGLMKTKHEQMTGGVEEVF